MLLPILILILVKFKYPCQCLKTPSLYSLLVPSSVSQIWPSTESPSQMRSWDVQGQVYRIPQLASMKSVKLCLQLTQDWKKVKKSSPKTCQPKVGPLMAIYQLTMDWEKADCWPTVKFLGRSSLLLPNTEINQASNNSVRVNSERWQLRLQKYVQLTLIGPVGTCAKYFSNKTYKRQTEEGEGRTFIKCQFWEGFQRCPLRHVDCTLTLLICKNILVKVAIIWSMSLSLVKFDFSKLLSTFSTFGDDPPSKRVHRM